MSERVGKGKPPKHSQFKKGQSGNPLGAQLHDKDLKMLKRLTKEEMKEVGNLVIKGSVDELRAIARDPNASALKTMIAAVCVKIISKGDMQALDVLLNRLIGKVKDEIEHTGSLAAPQVIVSLPANGTEKK